MNKITEIEELKALILEGNKLKKLPESDNVFDTSISSGLAIPITSQMDIWINKSIEYIYSLLPKTIISSDFAEVVNIYESCVGKSQIITSNRKKNINKVINVLNACLSFWEWSIAFDYNKLDAQQTAKFCFDPLEATFLYVQKELISSLVGLEDGITKKTALLHLYGRIFSVAHGIVKLNDLLCCHLLTASLRILLELYIDMLLIKDCVITNDIEKFFAFSKVYKFRSLSNLIRLDEELQKPITYSSNIKKIVQDSAQINQNANKLWGRKPKKINHWTDISLEERARRSNELEIYRNVYYYGNMYIHSGYLHFPKTEDEAHLLCSHAYSLSLEIFYKSTKLLCNEIDIIQGKEAIKEVDKIYFLHGLFQIWKSLVAASRE